jgi:pimeloyl-ACP methyl ester carboxylesterase
VRRIVGDVAMVCLVMGMPALAQAQAQDRFFDSDGVRIRYTDQGSGEVVVLLHGNGGTLQGWPDAGVVPDLVQDYRVLAFDARGHGRSGKPHEVRAYGPEMGLDVVRLLDHVGVRRAHIVGYALGAATVAQLVTAHPDRFITATLGGGAGRFRWTAEDSARADVEASEKERDCVSRTQILRLAPANQPKPTDQDIRKRSEACMADPGQDRFALAALARSLKDQAITPAQAAAVTVPTLGVVGTLDPAIDDFQELQKLRPALELVVIEGATHGGERSAMRRPEFLAALRRFVAAHPGDAGSR